MVVKEKREKEEPFSLKKCIESQGYTYDEYCLFRKRVLERLTEIKIHSEKINYKINNGIEVKPSDRIASNKIYANFTRFIIRKLKEDIQFKDIKNALIREINYRIYYREPLGQIQSFHYFSKKCIYWTLTNRQKIDKEEVYFKLYFNDDDYESFNKSRNVERKKEKIANLFEEQTNKEMPLIERLKLLGKIVSKVK